MYFNRSFLRAFGGVCGDVLIIKAIRVVVPASGVGLRFGGELPKQFAELHGEPVLKRTLSVFDRLDFVEDVAVAVPKGYELLVEGWGYKKPVHVVSGGASRGESVLVCLKCFKNYSGVVLIHDGIRPFVTGKLAKSVAEAALKHGAAVAAVPVTDTVKVADASGRITDTPDRRRLWRAQTPQGFLYDVIMRAYEKAEADGYISEATDDSFLAERLGLPVFIVPGSESNIKITTPVDMITARAIAGGEIL